MTDEQLKALAPKWMMKNSKGKPDAILTLLIIAFFIVSVRVVLGALSSFHVFGHTIEIREMGALEIGAYLGTIFSSYVAKRNFGNRDGVETPPPCADNGGE